MSLLDRKASRIRISEVLQSLEARELPVVSEAASIEEVMAKLVKCRHSRALNVVNDNQQLVGTISIGALTRHVFAQDREPTIHARSLIGLLARETAGAIMRTHPIYTNEEEEVGTVLRRMLKANIKEIPVLDHEKRVIADLTVVDLLEHLLALG